MENILDDVMDKPDQRSGQKSIYISGDDFVKLQKATSNNPGHTVKSLIMGSVDIVEMIRSGVVTAVQTSKLGDVSEASIKADLKNFDDLEKETAEKDKSKAEAILLVSRQRQIVDLKNFQKQIGAKIKNLEGLVA